MTHPDDALRLIENMPLDPLPEESVPIDDALGRVLARNLPALVDQPPFDKATMDGFAWTGEPSDSFEITETIAAGGLPRRPLAGGKCARIMTGAPLPPGANRVQRVEWTSEEGGRVRFTQEEPTKNVILRGENQKAGDPLLSRRILAPTDIGILAYSGYAEVPVVRRPIVGVASTGDELRDPGQELEAGTIYDSNGYQLRAQARASGCEVRSYGRVPDNPGALDKILGEALEACDILLLSGGVSMGDFDYVPDVLMRRGVEKTFHKLAMKPGKPTFFGRRGNVFVLGLPGNPMSAFVNFEIMVKALLRRLCGLPPALPTLRVRISSDVSRDQTERVEFLPARLENGVAIPIRYTGSTMLNALSEADVLLRMEIGQNRIEKGAEIDVRPIR